jgi:hypothetical protein
MNFIRIEFCRKCSLQFESEFSLQYFYYIFIVLIYNIIMLSVNDIFPRHRKKRSTRNRNKKLQIFNERYMYNNYRERHIRHIFCCLWCRLRYFCRYVDMYATRENIEFQYSEQKSVFYGLSAGFYITFSI